MGAHGLVARARLKMTDHEIRMPTEDEIRGFGRAVMRGFAEFPHPDEADDFQKFLERIHLLGAFDGPAVAGTISLTVGVPGYSRQ